MSERVKDIQSIFMEKVWRWMFGDRMTVLEYESDLENNIVVDGGSTTSPSSSRWSLPRRKSIYNLPEGRRVPEVTQRQSIELIIAPTCQRDRRKSKRRRKQCRVENRSLVVKRGERGFCVTHAHVSDFRARYLRKNLST
eukprot:358401_1